uniref:NADH:ubiquinone reductase (H(+)-translocating) n=1 Tax=Pratylenchus vulnus TaxID=45931 RepID=M1E1R6_PRAVU|nr:NADH dehydrogenase subunit 5 [Pratylenchus vulnus]
MSFMWVFLGFFFILMTSYFSFYFGLDFFFLQFFFFLSPQVTMFLSMLMLVFLIIIFFSFFYMNGYYFYSFFLVLILIFLLVMMLFLISSSNHLIYFSWDLLGVSSFFLVIYYLTWVSISGGLITILSNRWGDFFLMLWTLMNTYFMEENLIFSFFLNWVLILTSSTKSAQVPFHGWLPKAMEAPTPVSALVHSSTLVTSGLLLSMSFMSESADLIELMSFLTGFMSLFFSSFLAVVESDAKQLVAWSTLSQVALANLFFSVGYTYYCFMHLISHAFFKSLLFLQIGFFINMNMGEQDMRKSQTLNLFQFFNLSLVSSWFSLASLYFTGGMLSKDIFFEMLFEGYLSFFVSLIFLMGASMTFFYLMKMYSLFSSISVLLKMTFSWWSLIGFFLIFLSLFFIMFMLTNFMPIPLVSGFYLYFWVIFLFSCSFFYLVYNFFKSTVNFYFLANYFFFFFLGFFSSLMGLESSLLKTNILMINYNWKGVVI